MGSVKSKSKYAILYGHEGSGKTLLQYALQSSVNMLKDINPTEGFNYEEINVKSTNLGIFDLSGNMNQYDIVNIITKCVNISAIIFVVPLKKMEDLDKSRAQLELILGNNYLNDGISLLVIYNKEVREKDKLSWIPLSLLDARLKLENLKKKYQVAEIKSCIIDVSLYDDSDKLEFDKSLEYIVDVLEKEK